MAIAGLFVLCATVFYPYSAPFWKKENCSTRSSRDPCRILRRERRSNSNRQRKTRRNLKKKKIHSIHKSRLDKTQEVQILNTPENYPRYAALIAEQTLKDRREESLKIKKGIFEFSTIQIKKRRIDCSRQSIRRFIN